MSAGALISALSDTANGLDALLARSDASSACADGMRMVARVAPRVFPAAIEAVAGAQSVSVDQATLVVDSALCVVRNVLLLWKSNAKETPPLHAEEGHTQVPTDILAAVSAGGDCIPAEVSQTLSFASDLLGVLLTSQFADNAVLLRTSCDCAMALLGVAVAVHAQWPFLDTAPLWRASIRLLVKNATSTNEQRMACLVLLLRDAGIALGSHSAGIDDARQTWAQLVRAALRMCKYAMRKDMRLPFAPTSGGLSVLLSSVPGGDAVTELLAVPVLLSASDVSAFDAFAASLGNVCTDGAHARGTLGFYLRSCLSSGSVSSAVLGAPPKASPAFAPEPLPKVAEYAPTAGAAMAEQSFARPRKGRGRAATREETFTPHIGSAAVDERLPTGLDTVADIVAAATAPWTLPRTGRVVPRQVASLATALVGAYATSPDCAARTLFSAVLRRVLAGCDSWALVTAAAVTADGGGVIEQLVLAAHVTRSSEDKHAPGHSPQDTFVRERLAPLFSRWNTLAPYVQGILCDAAANIAAEHHSPQLCLRVLDALLLAGASKCPQWYRAAAACLRHCELATEAVPRLLSVLDEAPECAALAWPIIASVPFAPSFSPARDDPALGALMARMWAGSSTLPAARAAALKAVEVFLRHAPEVEPVQAAGDLGTVAIAFLERSVCEEAGASSILVPHKALRFLALADAVVSAPMAIASVPADDAEHLIARLSEAMRASPSVLQRVRALVRSL